MDSHGTQRIKVLLIEDDACYQLLTRTTLEDDSAMAAELVTTERLGEGLAALARREFDLILTDLNLPDSTGIATFERLLAGARNIPIIVLSNQLDETIAPRVLRLGAQNYLSKTQLAPGILNRMIRLGIESRAGWAGQTPPTAAHDAQVQAIHQANRDAMVSPAKADNIVPFDSDSGRLPWPFGLRSTAYFGLISRNYSSNALFQKAFPAIARSV
jgi:DNA-binding NarL/FixJ family response regulator